MDAGELIAAVQRTGIVGLGGGIFPTHAKLRVPKEFPVDTLVVNGCECEPYLTSDHRIMVERAADLLSPASPSPGACWATRARSSASRTTSPTLSRRSAPFCPPAAT